MGDHGRAVRGGKATAVVAKGAPLSNLKATDRARRRLKLPNTPPLLEDDRLLRYGHPAEHRMLALTLTAIAISILVAAAVWFRGKDILLGLARGWSDLSLDDDLRYSLSHTTHYSAQR